jgi:hypothetical protein
MFTHEKGDTKTVYRPRPASTVFSVGEVVAYNGSGQVEPAVAGDTEILGVCKEAVTSADDDYATANVLVAIQVPSELHVEWEADTSSAVAADIGGDVDLTDSETVDRAATLTGVVRIVEVDSADKVTVELN